MKNKNNKDTRWITVVGAREHNLKDITVQIPKESLTVITGPSGSGKSSLALDILYAEGQRRYMESLSAYARQFLGMPKKPDFDRIDGLCPAIAIDQKTVGSNPRSTVGTITEIYDYVRVLFARIGTTHCPTCNHKVETCTHEQITQLMQDKYQGKMISITAPIVRQEKGEFVQELLQLFEKGYHRFLIDERLHKFTSIDEIQALKLGKTYKHTIDVLIDTLTITNNVDEKIRLQEAVEKACGLAEGLCKVIVDIQNIKATEVLYSTKRMCLDCGTAFPELEPRMFSFNSPLGACNYCHGIGMIADDYHWRVYTDEVDQALADGASDHITICPGCNGKRLNPQALAVTIGDKNIFELCELSIQQALQFFDTIELSAHEKAIVARLLDEIKNRLQFLKNVGLGYLSLNRTARTLSGGEGQRIRLARQLGSALSGVLYILDEPSIGLHQKDNDQLIETLQSLRDQGNTVVVVEHDHDTMAHADYLIDMGPAAGVHGGTIVAHGTPDQLKKDKNSITGAFLAGKRTITRLNPIRTPKGFLTLHNARANNLKDLSVKIPLGVLCGVSGVSGSGKSSLIMDELVPSVGRALHKRGSFNVSKIEGIDQLANMVVIDQSPIGRTPRSNPATYLGIFDDIRNLFASLPESKARGYACGRFSFNVAGGRCATCSGDGTITVSMHFLPDVTMICKDCKGQRYAKQTLEIRYKGKNIAQILDMTAAEAVEFFNAHASLKKRLELLCDVGLDYVKLGQPSTTLSGGEAQRIKLVHELAKRGSDTLYILDEPTTGLHASDIEKLLQVFKRLIDKGNSMIVIEHNLDVLKTADYIIDLGPDGGDAGGLIVAQGTPEQVATHGKSHTGVYLQRVLC
jgi:excinuclease ABC subunit A